MPKNTSFAANGLTAIYFPDGLKASDVIPKLLEHGIVIAGGLHKDIKDKYFRIGHMGITVINTPERNDLDRVEQALLSVFKAVGHL